MDQKKILCVGLNCVDIVSVCNGYPLEDSDQRDIEQRWQRGGNASNSSSVLSILGAQAECMASIAHSNETPFVLEDFKKYGISYKFSVMHHDLSCPMSVVIINKNNGSRTIIHSNKNLPEVAYEEFKKIDLKSERFSWIHFEGRKTNVGEILKMLNHIDKFNESLPDKLERIVTSVEIEKSCEELGLLFGKTDHTFVSKEYAQYRGYSNKQEAVLNLSSKCKNGGTLICAWGEDGACGIVHHSNVSNSDQNQQLQNQPAYSPAKVVDTLGAGDSFNAATIFSLCNGHNLQDAIQFGCKVAGTKCGIQGFWDLKEFNFVP